MLRSLGDEVPTKVRKAKQWKMLFRRRSGETRAVRAAGCIQGSPQSPVSCATSNPVSSNNVLGSWSLCFSGVLITWMPKSNWAVNATSRSLSTGKRSFTPSTRDGSQIDAKTHRRTSRLPSEVEHRERIGQQTLRSHFIADTRILSGLQRKRLPSAAQRNTRALRSISATRLNLSLITGNSISCHSPLATQNVCEIPAMIA